MHRCLLPYGNDIYGGRPAAAFYLEAAWIDATRPASILIIAVSCRFLEFLPTDGPEKQQCRHNQRVLLDGPESRGLTLLQKCDTPKPRASSASSLHAFGWKVTQTIRIVSIVSPSGSGARQRASSASSLPVCRWPAMMTAMLTMLAFRTMLMMLLSTLTNQGRLC